MDPTNPFLLESASSLLRQGLLSAPELSLLTLELGYPIRRAGYSMLEFSIKKRDYWDESSFSLQVTKGKIFQVLKSEM